MGKLRAIIPIVLAIMVAAGGSTYIYRWTKKQGATKTVVKVVKEEAVVVALQPAFQPSAMSKEARWVVLAMAGGWCEQLGTACSPGIGCRSA